MDKSFPILIHINENKNITFIIKINYQYKYILMSNAIKKKINNNEEIKITCKSSSTIIHCPFNSNFIDIILELILFYNNHNYENILIKLNNNKYFLYENNINKFYFINNIDIDLKSKFENINLKLLTKLKKINFLNININSIDIKNNLPDSLENIKFTKFNKPINHMVSYLNTLDTGNKFNSIINIPDTKLIQIIFGYSFNQEVDNLPETLQIIKFGYKFNRTVNNLPCCVHTIYFGYSFNQEVSYLPESIEKLFFDYEFNQELFNLPIGLKNLQIYSQFNKNICKFNKTINSIPNNIENFTLLNERYKLSIDKLPNKLKNINILTNFAYKTNKYIDNTNIYYLRKIINEQKLNCKIKLVDDNFINYT